MKILDNIFKFFKKSEDPKNPSRIVTEVLKKFKEGAAINSEEELRVLDRYASTGMVRFGFDYKTRQPTASLTNQGRWFLKQP